ncbi:hypothetical protein CQ018_12245 [Arthrobacter sp. MYb227]|uniref:glycosyltransferase n=1 Tax=Arthrobacter sp. MYb227 TaxID=1848601 RepID=UPI000CFB20A2|nr:glycosyltransferase [Arthrobacter sp. MYb227]PQZ92268.1 hypothetical protein CQ018_12245 [Arthrobacter sp. MYb227]
MYIAKKTRSLVRRIRTRFSSDYRPAKNSLLVSVIVPVFNTEPYLPAFLESLVSQDLPSDRFEVIVVNDGSTDDSGNILDRFAEKYSNITVIHQENSGWAGKPRNVGLSMAKGHFVFFADGDDLVSPESLRRMCEFALKNQLDVVLPKTIGIGGRKQTSGIYAKTQLSVSPVTALKTMTPQKLVLRSLIEKNRLQFAEEPVRLEDGMFMAACYLLAKRIGIAADYDYYSLRARADGSNISFRPIDPQSYTDSISKIATIIAELGSDPTLIRDMTVMLWRRKGLKIYEPARFRRYAVAKQDQWISAHSLFLKAFLPVQATEELHDLHRRKTELIRAQQKAELLELCDTEEEFALPIQVNTCVDNGKAVELEGLIVASKVSAVRIVVRPRRDQATTFVDLLCPVLDGRFSANFDLSSQEGKIMDFLVGACLEDVEGQLRRLEVSPDSMLKGTGRREPYVTANGYLSVRPR